MTIDPAAALDLADYRRKVASLYEAARHGGPGLSTHSSWIDARDVLFRSHPQSAIRLSPKLRAQHRVELPAGSAAESDFHVDHRRRTPDRGLAKRKQHDCTCTQRKADKLGAGDLLFGE